MNKKVKWSVISVTSATFLSFAWLVAGNSNAGTNQNQTQTSETNNLDDQTAATDGHYQGQDGPDWGQQDQFSQSPGWGDSDSDYDSDQNQDQYYQAPSGGFDQGQNSSGTSR